MCYHDVIEFYISTKKIKLLIHTTTWKSSHPQHTHTHTLTHRYHAEQTKPNTKEYTLDGSLYVKSENRQNELKVV